LFNISITTGKIPGKWKLSAVVLTRLLERLTDLMNENSTAEYNTHAHTDT